MNQKTLQEIFSDFIFAVYKKRPNELPAEQARDLQFTFFAGAVAVDEAYIEVTEHEDEVAFEKLEAIQNEIKQFVQDSFPDHLKN